ncbi:MAG: T9SS type A sorting domain-containing protein [Bacteroidales bacterium]|nr:T9SS type A sorting domain-containing protein [Bacteroidales bacterium]
MKKQILITLTILFSTSFAFAQNTIVFEKLYYTNDYPGVSCARCVTQCNDGGYLLGGYATFGAWYDQKMLLLKVDSLGNEEWRKHYGEIPSSYNMIWDLQQLQNGNIICCGSGSFIDGSSNDLKPRNSIIICVDSVGNMLWYNEANLGQKEEFNNLVINDNKVICSGWAKNPPTKDYAKPILGICNTNGEELNSRTLDIDNTENDMFVRSICNLSYSKNAIVGDYGSKSFLCTINNQGDTIQTKIIGNDSPSQQTLYDITFIDGEIICCGLINDNIIDNAHNAYFAKYDNSLNIISDFWYPFENEEEIMFAKKVVAEANGDFIVAGVIGTPDRNWETWIKKHNSNNEILWEKCIGYETGSDEIQHLIKTADGGYAILVFFNNYDGPSAISLIKIDKNGNGNYSSPVLTISNSLNYVNVYPNPASNNCYIEFSDNLASEYIEIYSLTGVLVLSYKIENKKQMLNTSQLKSGLYIITDEKRSFTKKLIINN